jgi:L-rhamnose isomerase
MEKALLMALLTPNAQFKTLQDEGNFTELMVRMEEAKMLPVSAIWKEYLSRLGVADDYLSVIKEYEKNVLSAR